MNAHHNSNGSNQNPARNHSLVRRFAQRCTSITLSTIGLSLLLLGNSVAGVNRIPDPANFEQSTTIRSFNETTTLAEELWANLTTRFVDLYEKGEYNTALTVAQRAYDIALDNFGLNDVNTADTLLKLGIINQTLGNLSTAEDHLLGSLVILEDQLNPDHPDVAIAATNLGNVYFEMERFRESEKYHQLALKIRQNAFGESNPVVAQSTYNLAVLYEREKNYSKAESFYNRAVMLWSKSVGPTHPYVANALNNLANIYTAQKKFQEAANVLQRTVAYKKAVFGSQHAEVAQSLISLGTAYLEQGKYDHAGSAYSEALDIAQHVLPSSDPQLALLMYTLANIYHMQARMSGNTSMTSMSHDTDAGATKTADNPASAYVSVENSTEVASNELFEQALPLYKQAAEILDDGQSKDLATLDVVLTELAMLYKAIGNTDMAAATESRLSTH
jgi:tetratricopeptide (TPR) repeat protein